MNETTAAKTVKFTKLADALAAAVRDRLECLPIRTHEERADNHMAKALVEYEAHRQLTISPA